MLTTAIELPADGVLAGVIERAEPRSVLEACREQLETVDPARRAAWRHCRMIEALYHPGRYVRIAYVLLDDDGIPPKRSWPDGQVIYVQAPVRSPVSARGSTITIDGHCLEVYRFPNDRRLRGLRRFAGRRQAVETWQRWMDEAGDDFRIDADTLRRGLIRYVPEQKWVAGVRARGVSVGTGDSGMRRIAVRGTPPALAAALAQRYATVSTLLRDQSPVFRVPRVVGVDRTCGLFATEWIRGNDLPEQLRLEPPDRVMERVARLLKAFHALPTDGLERQSADDVYHRAYVAAQDLSATGPHIQQSLNFIVGELDKRLDRVGASAPVTLHDDFHWNQLRIKGQRFALFDLERMCVGDAMADVANFATQVRLLGRRADHPVGVETARTWAAAFLDQWTRISGSKIDPNAFVCHAVVSLLQLARGMMRHLRPGWRRLAETCVEQAVGRLSTAASEVIAP